MMCRLRIMSTLWLLRYIVTVLMTVPLGAEGHAVQGVTM